VVRSPQAEEAGRSSWVPKKSPCSWAEHLLRRCSGLCRGASNPLVRDRQQQSYAGQALAHTPGNNTKPNKPKSEVAAPKGTWQGWKAQAVASSL